MVSSVLGVKPLRYRLVCGGTVGCCSKFLILPAQGHASKTLQMGTFRKAEPQYKVFGPAYEDLEGKSNKSFAETYLKHHPPANL
jgi:hypothetical protein